MPENYYCLDNFFQKMTDLESPRKNNDCYFYYYSTCTKGDNCTFRHEPSALGCETTCSFWKEGKCINVRCNFRHMELRKNRKTIPCYWESQPSGCKKQHCPFMHVNKKDEGDDNQNLSDEHDEMCNIKSKKDEFAAPVVDPIVVNFEEESDNESSTPTQSSHLNATHQSHDHLRQAHCDQVDHQAQNVLTTTRTIRGGAKTVQVKTLEEIKLDRIQAESAAYYSYSDELTPKPAETDSANGRRGVFKRLQPLGSLQTQERSKEVNIKDVQVLTLDEIRRRKRKNQAVEESTEIKESKQQKVANEKSAQQTESKQNAVSQKQSLKTPLTANLAGIKIKTLAEIKAEKQLKRKLEEAEIPSRDCEIELDVKPETKQPTSKRVKITLNKEPDEQEVSSTSKSDENPLLNLAQDLITDAITKVQCVVAPVKRHIEAECEGQTCKPDLPLSTPSDIESKTIPEQEEQALLCKISGGDEKHIAEEKNVQGSSTNEDVSDAVLCKDDDKLDDLLLDDDDEDAEAGSLTLKAEDDILNDIDDLLNE